VGRGKRGKDIRARDVADVRRDRSFDEISARRQSVPLPSSVYQATHPF
jgi:hypothetical protein